MSANIEKAGGLQVEGSKYISLHPNEPVVTDEMLMEGLRQWRSERKFESDWESVVRIYRAMRYLEPLH